MSAFENLRRLFGTNWTTILTGWKGLGVLSPWPKRWVEFPSLLSSEELAVYANERLTTSSDPTEHDLIAKLLSLDLSTEGRETIRDVLQRLSDLDGGDPANELRKWRLVMLEQALAEMPRDALYGLTALTEFWQNFGFPPDSPHEVQGRGNSIPPSEYYQQGNLDRLLARHREWIEGERVAIQ